PEEKRDKSYQWHRVHTGAFRMAEKTGGTKGDAPALDTLERFFERVHDEPEDAAHFVEEIACELADSLSNQNGRLSVCHEREVASLRYGEKDKLCCELDVKRHCHSERSEESLIIFVSVT